MRHFGNLQEVNSKVLHQDTSVYIRKKLMENEAENEAEILRKSLENHKAQFQNVFANQKSILRHYYIHNVEDGIQILA